MMLLSLALATSVAYFGSPEGRPEYAMESRRMSGIASLAVSPVNGRMWCSWYGGVTTGEDTNNYVILSTSIDHGKTWREVMVADPDGAGPRRTFDPALWVTPNGKLWWTWCDRNDEKDSKDKGSLWLAELSAEDLPSGREAPREILPDSGVMMCRPTVLRDGAWALPVSRWHEEGGVRMYVTTDGGKTFTLRGAGTIPKDDQDIEEHIFVQRKDGDVDCYARCKSGVRISRSRDLGRTWGPFEKAPFVHPNSRLFVRRLKSGNLLLVKHCKLDEPNPSRTDLRAFVSKDDGKTWEGGLLLDPRVWISYPDGQEMDDGTIYVCYDFARYNSDQHVCFATFTEADAVAAKNVSGKVTRQNLVTARCFSERCGRRTLDADGNALAAKFERIPYSPSSTNGVLDLSVPAGKGYATLVWLRTAGRRAEESDFLTGFDSGKMSVVTVSLPPQDRSTNRVEETVEAVNWTLEHISEYGGDPKKVFVGGHASLISNGTDSAVTSK